MDPARLRYVFGQIFSEVRLWWTPRTPGRRSSGKVQRYRFSRDIAILRGDDDEEDNGCIGSTRSLVGATDGRGFMRESGIRVRRGADRRRGRTLLA